MLRKRVMVTGGAGFLGSHLCERLLERSERRRVFGVEPSVGRIVQSCIALRDGLHVSDGGRVIGGVVVRPTSGDKVAAKGQREGNRSDSGRG